MKRFGSAFFASAVLLFSCGGHQTGGTMDLTTDSLADTSDTVSVDTMELLITETPMPRAADAMFDDFIFNFVANKRLQKERIVFPLRITTRDGVKMFEKSRWRMKHFFMRQGYYTLLFDNDQQMALMKDTAVSEAIVEKISFKKNLVQEYMFQRIHGAWMMTEVREVPLAQHTNASFLSFYHQFAVDSAFQKRSLNATVQFVGPDPDDDFTQMEGMLTADTWEAFAPQLPSKVIYNIVYGKPQPPGPQKIFLMRGVANGQELELRFKKTDNRWLLTKMTT